MGLFSRKPKIVREIHDGIWGHLVGEHKFAVDTISRDIRCVEKPGNLEGGYKVTLLRVFSLSEVGKKGIVITGWEIFDQYPDLILLEGYYDARNNTAHLKRTRV